MTFAVLEFLGFKPAIWKLRNMKRIRDLGSACETKARLGGSAEHVC